LTRLLPAGDAALCVVLGQDIDPLVAARVRALEHALRQSPFPGFLEAVPSYRSLLVLFDGARLTSAEASAALEARIASPLPAPPEPRLHEVPVVYGGEYGPDLESVAAACGLRPSEVIALHAGIAYTAFMLGFAPGFAYLGLLDPRLERPRRRTPRTAVPAGSVAIAGRQTGIYPARSAGGWHLLGRTGLRLFDPDRDPPALVQPGDRVLFRPVAALETLTPSAREAPEVADPALELLDGGVLTSVQDAGRPGWRRYGVTEGGAADRGALLRANRAVGNPDTVAGMECTLVGPVLRFLAPTRFAIAGADLGAVLERSDLGPWIVRRGIAVQARPGNVLRFTGRRAGCRAMVAFAGGLEAPPVLGSRATDLLGGFGGHAGRALLAGDRLGLGQARGPALESPEPPPAEEAVVRVVPGPQADHFDDGALAQLLATTWEVTPDADRVGIRLRGPCLAPGGIGEIVSDGMLPGSIQVPPDGQPIVMFRDAPTTGGYPKIATMVSADLDLLAQLVPGAGRLRFTR
jgi:KipI family sensor histidine kinase inhibitor